MLSGRVRTRYRIASVGGRGMRDNIRLLVCPGAPFSAFFFSFYRSSVPTVRGWVEYSTQPLTVAKIARLRLESSRLAYLSACHSAANLAEGLAKEPMDVTGERCARALHGSMAEMAEEDEGFFIGWASWIHAGD
jgi:hypothetical protein